MSVFSFITLLGGLAMLIYGMSIMGGGLEKMSGGKLERILERLTSNRFKGVLLGAGVTSVIQSSSATTVMVVGFVNSGIMKLTQAVGIIMGANIGTTITAWILSLTGIQGDSVWVKLLKPSSFSPVLAFAGIILLMFSRRGRRRDLGTIFLGFAVLMFGMITMSDTVKPLTEVPWVSELFTLFSNPLLGVLVGAFLTAILQSSSATVGILQAVSASGLVSFGAAVPILCGQNIGTCVTAMLSSAGATRNARRAAVIHLFFNIIGTLLFLSLFYIVKAFIDMPFISSSIGPFEIAIVHTVFNVFTTAVLFPFAKQLVKLSTHIIKDKDSDRDVALLDERFLSSPSFALEHCRTVTQKMAELSRDTLLQAVRMVSAYDDKTAVSITENEEKIDSYEDKLGSYLVKLSSHELSEKDSKEAALLLSAIGDFERISDHAINILEAAQEIRTKQISFSDEAYAELDVIASALEEVLNITIDAFVNLDLEAAYNVEPLEEVIDILRNELKAHHVQRLQDNKCTIGYGFVFLDLLTNYERVSDHCSNIAISVIQTKSPGISPHGFITEVKKTGFKSSEKYEQYRNKYLSRITQP